VNLRGIGNFRVKLVVWFGLLALLPLAIAFYGYGRLTTRSEERRADATLQGNLRTALTAYAAQLDAAAVRAETLAARPAVQTALRHRDAAALRRALHGERNASATASGVRVGRVPPQAEVRTVPVVFRGRRLGAVTVAVPLDAAVLRQLAAGFAPGDRLVLVRPSTLRPGAAGPLSVDGTRYRALASAPVGGVSIAAVTPQHAIDAAARSSLETIAAALFAALAVFIGVTYLLGRSIVDPLARLAAAAQALAQGRLDQRVEVHGRDEFAQVGAAFNDMAGQLQARLDELEHERGRARAANARFGAALAASLDPGQLLRTVVQTAVEETGAAGGMVVRADDAVARVGTPQDGTRRIQFPLRAGATDFGTLVLVGESFDEEQIETVTSLAAQAVVALENARLHRMVERQALLDGLTGLANRRSVEETLRTEVARSRRFDDKLCVVMADLDDFKQVNDTYGHPVGDDALRLFADTLRATVREMDVAGRWGGEEFVLVLPGTDATGGARLAERARVALESCALEVDGDRVPLTASFGVAELSPTADVRELVAAADAALYEAKRTGKNRVMV
jgi:diguanylate cyclase (GGDEF)-like protein